MGNPCFLDLVEELVRIHYPDITIDPDIIDSFSGIMGFINVPPGRTKQQTEALIEIYTGVRGIPDRTGPKLGGDYQLKFPGWLAFDPTNPKLLKLLELYLELSKDPINE